MTHFLIERGVCNKSDLFFNQKTLANSMPAVAATGCPTATLLRFRLPTGGGWIPCACGPFCLAAHLIDQDQLNNMNKFTKLICLLSLKKDKYR